LETKKEEKGKIIMVDRKEIVQKYIDECRSLSALGREYHISRFKVRDILEEANIPIRIRGYRPRTLRIPTDARKLAYIAGIVDGEGTISYTHIKNGFREKAPFIAIKNTDKNLIDWLVKTLGGNVSEGKVRKGWKTPYRWYKYSTLDVYDLVSVLRPYLIIKKENADLVLKICKERMGKI